MTGTLHEDLCTCLIMSFWIALRIIFQTKLVKKIKTHFIYRNLLSENRVIYEAVEMYGRAKQATDDNIIRRMCIACCINKATGTHSEYVIPIAFSWQQ